MSDAIQQLAEKALQLYREQMQHEFTVNGALLDEMFDDKSLVSSEQNFLRNWYLSCLSSFVHNSAQILESILILSKHSNQALLPHACRGIIENFADLVLLLQPQQKSRRESNFFQYIVETYQREKRDRTRDIQKYSYCSDDLKKAMRELKESLVQAFRLAKELNIPLNKQERSLAEKIQAAGQVLSSSTADGAPITNLRDYYSWASESLHGVQSVVYSMPTAKKGHYRNEVYPHPILGMADFPQNLFFFLSCAGLYAYSLNLICKGSFFAFIHEFRQIERKSRAEKRQERMSGYSAQNHADACDYDIRYWSKMTPEERLDAYMILRQEAERISGKRAQNAAG